MDHQFVAAGCSAPHVHATATPSPDPPVRGDPVGGHWEGLWAELGNGVPRFRGISRWGVHTTSHRSLRTVEIAKQVLSASDLSRVSSIASPFEFDQAFSYRFAKLWALLLQFPEVFDCRRRSFTRQRNWTRGLFVGTDRNLNAIFD